MKICAITTLLVLVVFSLLADMPFMRQLERGLSLGAYVRVASLLGLAAAVFYAWGYKREIELSQKYRRANEIIEQAESEAARRRTSLDQQEARMKADIAEKEADLDLRIGQAVSAYQQRANRLKEQNMELKETVSKLIQALKAERAGKA
jgi:hypothetical protein